VPDEGRGAGFPILASVFFLLVAGRCALGLLRGLKGTVVPVEGFEMK